MKRCCTPQHLISEEQPVLLDPTVAADPGLLSFNEDGMAAPTYPESTAPWLHRRAKESIAIYHLNHADLKEARQVVCMECKRKVTEGDQALREYSYGSAVAEDRFKRIVADLRERLKGSAEYSAAARATLMGLRSNDRPWLDTLLVSA
jgi:hypothetical protein